MMGYNCLMKRANWTLLSCLFFFLAFALGPQEKSPWFSEILCRKNHPFWQPKKIWNDKTFSSMKCQGRQVGRETNNGWLFRSILRVILKRGGINAVWSGLGLRTMNDGACPWPIQQYTALNGTLSCVLFFFWDWSWKGYNMDGRPARFCWLLPKIYIPLTQLSKGHLSTH